jgi:hypothetical protein
MWTNDQVRIDPIDSRGSVPTELRKPAKNAVSQFGNSDARCVRRAVAGGLSPVIARAILAERTEELSERAQKRAQRKAWDRLRETLKPAIDGFLVSCGGNEFPGPVAVTKMTGTCTTPPCRYAMPTCSGFGCSSHEPLVMRPSGPNSHHGFAFIRIMSMPSTVCLACSRSDGGTVGPENQGDEGFGIPGRHGSYEAVSGQPDADLKRACDLCSKM